MRVTSVSYKKIFPGDQPFTNETIGVEVSVDEGEDINSVFSKAKSIVYGWGTNAIAYYGQRSQDKLPEGFIKATPNGSSAEVIPVINKNDEKLEIAIDNAQTIEELNALSKNLPVHLMTTFVNKLTELKKQ